MQDANASPVKRTANSDTFVDKWYLLCIDTSTFNLMANICNCAIIRARSNAICETVNNRSGNRRTIQQNKRNLNAQLMNPLNWTIRNNMLDWQTQQLLQITIPSITFNCFICCARFHSLGSWSGNESAEISAQGSWNVQMQQICSQNSIYAKGLYWKLP